MNCVRILFASITLSCSLLSATEFTISTYNAGGLSDHYDYLRAIAMEKLLQERYSAEPEAMSQNEKIQQLALEILFTRDPLEKARAEQEWHQRGYQNITEHITTAPTAPNSPNAIWNQKSEEIITNYRIRPVVIHDAEVKESLTDHLRILTKNSEGEFPELVEEARGIMAKRIFSQHLKFDIICLQEADYLDASMFPSHYEVLLAESDHSKNGVAWNKNRFERVATVGSVSTRGFIVQLRDKESNKTILVASGHITGCNPYRIVNDSETGQPDSFKGDAEVDQIVELLDNHGADFMLIGMDSNVTSLHPRLHILKAAGYQIDYKNHFEQTCTNPAMIVNTRLDWIALKSSQPATITNIPVLSVGLNNMITNISDHKPVAAKIEY